MVANNKGLTLMELIVVITIILVLGTITGLNITKALPTYSLRSAAGEVYSNISRARSMAIKFKRNVSVKFDVAHGGYILDPGGILTAHYLNQHIPSEKNSSGVYKTISDFYGGGVNFGFPGKSDAVTFASDTITFDSVGMPTECDKYVYLQNNKKESFRVGVKGLAGNLVIDRCKTNPNDAGIECN